MDNYIGRLLDNRYEILESIGTGGMAVVYKARCHRLNRMVAIKILKDELSVDAEFRRRFHAESQAVAMLSHPNIVNVYDVSHSENIDYIVMELIEGLTLKQYMQQKGSLNWREALHLSTQIAKALEHAHSRGIIHRDIKPHNIMILKDGTVKVADFGIARVSSAQSTLTREALGSVHYISPEQAKGGKIDYRSDLYSLGVVMYEMLTGQPPYDGESPVAVAIKHINAQAELPRTINSQIPLGLEQITMHAMAADLDMRYENATVMLSDLDEFRRNPNVNFADDNISVDVSGAVSSENETTAATASHKSSRAKKTAKAKNGSKKNTITLVAGILCIALAALFIGYFVYSFFLSDIFSNGPDVEVPNFLGTVAENIRTEDYPDFVIQFAETRTSETIEAGRIMHQEPEAYRMVEKGSTINLTISSGPSTDAMRDLVNHMEQNARTILDNLGLDLNVVVEYESSSVISVGAVIRTIPAEHEILSAGQTVTLVVSTGSDAVYVPMPELVGMDIDSAIIILDDMKLFYSIKRIDSDEPSGTVLYQSVKQTTEVTEGLTVNLHVSNGPKDDAPKEESEETVTDEHIIWIPAPAGNRTVELRVMIDAARVILEDLDLGKLSEEGIPLELNAQGIHTVEVFINDELWHSMTYDFDAGVQVER